MPTTIILVRHCAHDLIDRILVGRRIDVPLSAAGVEQAKRLAARLGARGLTRVVSSPQFRALQTARPLAGDIGRAIEIAPEFDEVDFGEWSGRSFDQLHEDTDWHRWNTRRDLGRPPGGESMAELQTRVLAGVLRLGEAHSNQVVAVITHAEPIRAAVLACRQIPLRAFACVNVESGAVVTLQVENRRVTLCGESDGVGAPMVAA